VVFGFWNMNVKRKAETSIDIQWHIDTWQMITLSCCVGYDEKQSNTLFFWKENTKI